jgi:hypothetical protein
MVLVVAQHNLAKPCTDLGRTMMLPALKLSLDGFELRDHSLLRRNPPDDEGLVADALPTEVSGRRIVHFNVTRHPTSSWIGQQLRDAFPYASNPKFLIFYHDAKYGFEVPVAVNSMKITPVRTSIGSPWQNGVAERWVGSCRRELLDHVVVLDERHLKRLLSGYIS